MLRIIYQMADPELAIDQAIQDWRRKGYSESWINTLVRALFPATAHCAGRANSPSILEGVPEGRGSNIGILIPFDILDCFEECHNQLFIVRNKFEFLVCIN